MSEPGPESIPTSVSKLSKRPLKKRPFTTIGQHAFQLDVLFARPDKEIAIPEASKPKTLAPPPEVVANVQGSSAGAGSGEFHVYKASRRREYERIRLMEEEVEKEQANKDWAQKQEELKKKDDIKTTKNKAKREKAKMRREKKKHGSENESKETPNGKKVVKEIKPMVPRPPVRRNEVEDADDNVALEDASAQPDEGGVVIHDDD
jgi:hypothetical protein